MDKSPKPKISVIIPAFNVEKYIIDCVDSILNQTFKDIEVLIVDNGSTDMSLKVISNIVEKNSNVTVYIFNEGGVGGARNYGISQCKGDYIMFVDADDILPNDALSNLYNSVDMEGEEKVDIVVGNMVNYHIDYSTSEIQHFNTIHKHNLTLNSIHEFHMLLMSQSPTNKLFYKKFLEIWNLKFPENLIHEDLYFTTLAYFRAKKIKIITPVVYLYRKFNQPSITSLQHQEHYFLHRLIILDMIDDYFYTNNMKKAKELFDNYKLEKFLLAIEKKLFTEYDKNLSLKLLEKIKKQLLNISIKKIKMKNIKSIEYILIKVGKYFEYEQYKVNQQIAMKADNGNLYLDINDNQIDETDNDILIFNSLYKRLKLKHIITELRLIRNTYSLKGYCYFQGLEIEKENLIDIQIFIKNYDNMSEVYNFKIEQKTILNKQLLKKVTTFIANIDLTSIQELENKNFKIYIRYFYAGVELEEQIIIDDEILTKFILTNGELTTWRLTNISKKYISNLMH